MKNLSLTFCLAIAALFGSVGSGFALPECLGSPTTLRKVATNWTNCFGAWTFGYDTTSEFRGNKYIGEFKNGAFHGQGSYAYLNGNRLVGHFSRGKANGKGTFIFAVKTCFNNDCFPAGLKYTGMVHNGAANGYGTAWFPNGTTLKGIWKNNKFQYAQKNPNLKKPPSLLRTAFKKLSKENRKQLQKNSQRFRVLQIIN